MMKKFLLPLCILLPLFCEEWTGKYMPTNKILNAGEKVDVTVTGTSSGRGNYLYSAGFIYSTNGSGTSELILTPKTTLTGFYNQGNIIINANSKLSMQFANTSFYMDKSTSYNVKKNAELAISGNEFTTSGGSFINQGTTTINLKDSFSINNKSTLDQGLINDGGVLSITASIFNNGRYESGAGAYGVFETTNGGSSTINASGGFSNFGFAFQIFSGMVSNKTPNTISIVKASSKGTLSINGGDVYNGGEVKRTSPSGGSAIYYSSRGNFIADDGVINIQKNFISEGAGASLAPSQYVSEALHSEVIVTNGGAINIGGDFTNKFYSNISVSNGGTINVTGNFQSQANTNIYFSGNASGYGKISANSIDITGANLVFYKGDAKTNVAYVFLDSKGALKYNTSILGTQDITTQDGSQNQFYNALIEDGGNNLKITFQSKTGDKTISQIISENTQINQNQSLIIDAIDTQKPIDGFDIRNCSTNQIVTMAQNIEGGIKDFSDDKNAFIRAGFNLSKTLVFNRMIKAQSLILPKKHLPRYAFNSRYSYAYASDESPPYDPATFQTQTLKTNAVYASVLGGYQKTLNGSGYNYGFNGGYDKALNKNIFLGFYAGYMGGNIKLDAANISTQSIQAGGYGRFNTSFIETDVIFGYINAFNQSVKKITIGSSDYANNAKYNTQALNLLLQTGPKFIFGSNIIKPYIGINTNYIWNDTIKEDGVLGSKYLSKNNVYMGAILGIEYRKYINGSYFFVQPSIEYTFYSNLKAIEVIFLNNILTIPAPKKENFASLLIGGEFPLNDKFLINLNASLKASNQSTLILGGSASLKFIF